MMIKINQSTRASFSRRVRRSLPQSANVSPHYAPPGADFTPRDAHAAGNARNTHT